MSHTLGVHMEDGQRAAPSGWRCAAGSMCSQFSVLRGCGGLNENGPHRLVYVNVWATADGTV